MTHRNQVKKLERLEAAFTVAKAHEDTHVAEYQAAKKELAAYRIRLRRETRPAEGEGDATAHPKTLKAKATLKKGI